MLIYTYSYVFFRASAGRKGATGTDDLETPREKRDATRY